MNEPIEPRTLMELASLPDVNAASRFTPMCRTLSTDRLVAAYDLLVLDSPQRHSVRKRYFVGHTGIPGTGEWTNRIEEHLAIALCNDARSWELPGGGVLELLDYQVPLKARQSDRGVGKIDLFAVSDSNGPVVIELKMKGKNRSDTPLRALLEAMTYAAIVEANADAFRAEFRELADKLLTTARPDVLIAAPSDYWTMWKKREAAAGWRKAFGSLCESLSERLENRITLLDIGAAEVEPGLEGTRPRLKVLPQFAEQGHWGS